MAEVAAGKAKREKSYSHPDRHWEVRDAMHTIMRAHEIHQNKPLMTQVRKHAAAFAQEKREEAHRAGQLAKAGKISAKQMAKFTKNRPIA